MDYLRLYKTIAIFSVVIILIGGYFIFSSSRENQKNKIIEAPTSNDSAKVSSPVLEKISIPKKDVPPLPVGTDRFVVSLNSTADEIAANLVSEGYIKEVSSFTVLAVAKTIAPGAYKIAKEMTPLQLLQILRGKPYMKWVVIPPGLRKEEIASLLATALGWTTKQKTEWITKSTTSKPEYIEGVYAPDTYLIPVGEKPEAVATRLIAKFNEGFAAYLPEFTAKNIKWTSALTLASIVQREAANVADMPLIAGILWNRLNQNMALNVDATLQYIRGDIGSGWWAPITLADKKIDSPYNTYKHAGLPPHPISNPSLDATLAVLNSVSTDCLYYLHDKNHITHCAVTYAEHEANITLYLTASAN